MLNQMPIAIVILTTITIFNNQVTTASSYDDDNSISRNYRDGYEVGKVQGRDDHRNGNEHNDRCPPENNGILWCIEYEIGYNDGYYSASEILGRK
jgi:hypothetical protein